MTNHSTNKDKFGFTFWLKWILWFAGSFVLSSILWTGLITFVFGKIRGNELIFTWAIAVFGSWFILLTPFMRKKEQIWKRLNQDEEKAVDAWLFGMGTIIGLLILSSLVSSFIFKDKIIFRNTNVILSKAKNLSDESISQNSRSFAHHKSRWTQDDSKGFETFNPSWAKAVFGSWLILILPLLVIMYRRADEIFKDAIIRQTQKPVSFRTVFVEKVNRILPQKISEKLRDVPATLNNSHIVNLKLKNGNQVPNVFVLNSTEVLGIYDETDLKFHMNDIEDIEPVDLGRLSGYEESKWLRLDGRA